MPDAIELIEADHRTVEELFDRFESEGDPNIARKVCQELTLHAEVEEQIFYPRVRQEVSQDLVEEAREEHQEARSLIEEIEALDENDTDRLRELMVQLRDDVEHHVEEEESEMLPQAREALSAELDDLGQAIEDFKGERKATLDLTKEELYEQAKQQDVPGRSQMDKEELAEVLEEP